MGGGEDFFCVEGFLTRLGSGSVVFVGGGTRSAFSSAFFSTLACFCVVDFFGRADLARPHAASHGYRVQFLGGEPEDDPARTRLASPLHHVSADDPPFLIVHGSEDATVPIWNSRALSDALRRAGVPVWLQIVEGGGHADFDSPEVDRRVRLFLDRVLRGKPVDVPTDVIQHAAAPER